MKRKFIKRKNKAKTPLRYITVRPRETAGKGDIDDYIYSWQSVKQVSER